MGLAQSPKVVTDGLVFYYDQNNVKSLTGPPIQNLATVRAFNNNTGTGISIVGGYETVDVPQVGQSNAVFSNIQNNYTSFSPNSGDCCPSPLYYGSGFTVSPSTLYTYAIVYKVNSGYTNSNYMYRYEYTASGGSYVTEGGVHSDSNRIHLGGGWYWAWGTFTTQATTNWIGYHSAFYYRYSNRTDKLSVAKVLIVRGDYTALHPRYWPEINTTRSSTQTLLDLTKRNTVTSTSLTYASNGAFSFDGVDDYIDTGNTFTFAQTDQFSVEVWLKILDHSDREAAAAGIIGKGHYYDNQWDIWLYNTNSIYFETTGNPTRQGTIYLATSALALDTWHHYVATYNNGAKSAYLNGVLVGTQTYTGPGDFSNSNNVLIGRRFGDASRSLRGSVSTAKIYNRALTEAEVRQNFNAHRGRYGI